MASSSSKASEEHIIRIPNVTEAKKFSLLKFNGNLNVDVTQWNKVILERENNAPAYAAAYSNAEGPEFGAGSEYGKKAKDEARRKKMGRYAKTYKVEAQPWLMNVQSNQGAVDRKFKGIREGSVNEFSDYWIFVKAADGMFDAYPISEWYNFLPQARYKTLDIDEAEEQFTQRNKVLNQFAVMKKPGGSNAADAAEDKSSVAVKDLRISDDRIKDDEDEAFNSDSDDEKDSKEEKPKKKVTKPAKKSKPKPARKGSDDEIASAESDDGDEEGEEVDYMSDSGSSSSDDDEAAEIEKEDKQLVGVAEESGLKAMIDSDAEEEQEEEDEAKEKDVNTTDMDESSRASLGDGPPRSNKEKDKDDESSSDEDDSDDPDKDTMQSALFMLKAKPLETSAANTDSNDASGPSGIKRKEISGETTEAPEISPAKKVKTTSASPPPKGITEEEVKRYLQRKPHATKDLVAKFKSKSLGLEKAEIVNRLAEILKKLKPEQNKVNGVLYFSLKN